MVATKRTGHLVARHKRASLPVEEGKKRGRKKKEDTVYEEFLQSNKRAPVDQINYKDLGAFDDLLTDCFVDKVSIAMSYSAFLFLTLSC